MSPQEIKELRLILGLSQEMFASVIGVSFTTCNRWENGKCKPSRLAIQKMKTFNKATV